MRTVALYLDTSFVSHLDAPDVPDKAEDTKRLWDAIIKGAYKPIISNILLEELLRCPEPKQSYLLTCLNELVAQPVSEMPESIELVKAYQKYGVLRPQCLNDLRHLALASVLECNYIVSWNFKHFVNVRTINRVQAVNQLMGYPAIQILPPPMLLEGDEENG